ncbi:uncharacterized protein VTP21DRAFT_2188 [Calcarisporiella thermophila]|uniref:uncharacterized protein n=1 Tax=Calcarisporiella thermophila TaxID=911321 RepID=UPI0037431A7E
MVATTSSNSSSSHEEISPSLSPTDIASSATSISSASAASSPCSPSPPASLHHFPHVPSTNKETTLSLELYRQNAQRSNDPNLQMDFCVYLLDIAKQQPDSEQETRAALYGECIKLLKSLAARNADAKFLLAECYATGAGVSRPMPKEAFSLYVQAAKQGHPSATYEAARCYEYGRGTRREPAKAYTFYLKAANAAHPGAMFRLALAELRSELGRAEDVRNGVKWMCRAVDCATPDFPHALYEWAKMHEAGYGDIVFQDEEYALSLYLRAADELGHAPSAYRLGGCYERGELGVPVDPARSVYYYGCAAEQGHRDACLALTSWYLVGCECLPQSDVDAYAWALRAAEKGLPRAEYSVGYFLSLGIGVEKDETAALEWYQKAAKHGDRLAIQQLKNLEKGEALRGKGGKRRREVSSADCVIA